MDVTLLGAAIPFNFSDGDIYQAVNNQFMATGTQLIAPVVMDKMIKAYRAYKSDGMSDGWILNEMISKMIQVTGGVGTYTQAQASNFITALAELQKGTVPDVYAPMTLKEAFDAGLGKFLPDLPWGWIIAGGLAIYFLPGMFGRYKRGGG
jgi:hypothetical protein